LIISDYSVSDHLMVRGERYPPSKMTTSNSGKMIFLD
jgi:hypothetical protein